MDHPLDIVNARPQPGHHLVSPWPFEELGQLQRQGKLGNKKYIPECCNHALQNAQHSHIYLQEPVKVAT